MSDMQACSRRIGEHIQYIIFRLIRSFVCLKALVFLPKLLP
ncbi:hypothetical protein CP061683_0942, partial [Chlamydia psittaci 06-1683]